MSSLLDRLKAGIQKTREGLTGKLDEVLHGKRAIDADLLEELEYALLTADVGVRTTTEILEGIRQKADRSVLQDASEIRALVRQQLLDALQSVERPLVRATEPPTVIFLIGVNGAGKTTTVGKLTKHLRDQGKSVLLCAADTFRAAAIEQLDVWAQRNGVEMIRQQTGADPSAVLFDSLQAGKARAVDYVIVDTAGRLHTKDNLMAELEKMKRTAARVIPDAPHEVFLVIDAVTGQNGLEQARRFTESGGVTGIVLTKLDGTARGGIVVAISRELGIPVRYAGVGEKVEDLLPFDGEKFVASLFDQ
jgi:fused signal recognition particle receptor